jgi:hypothetical protein
MGTHITIFEAIIVSGLSLFVYALIITIIDHFKSKSK